MTMITRGWLTDKERQFDKEYKWQINKTINWWLREHKDIWRVPDLLFASMIMDYVVREHHIKLDKETHARAVVIIRAVLLLSNSRYPIIDDLETDIVILNEEETELLKNGYKAWYPLNGWTPPCCINERSEIIQDTGQLIEKTTYNGIGRNLK